MLHALTQMLAPEAMRRLTLLINHVLTRERVATDRLRPHSGRCVRVRFAVADAQALPMGLPVPPDVCWSITPAGLLEWLPQMPPCVDLQVRVHLEDPITLARRALSGQRPEVDVEGDAALAGDVSWLITHLRWDIADDVERLCGPVAAQALSQAVRSLLEALRRGRTGLGV